MAKQRWDRKLKRQAEPAPFRHLSNGKSLKRAGDLCFKKSSSSSTSEAEGGSQESRLIVQERGMNLVWGNGSFFNFVDSDSPNFNKSVFFS